MVRLTVCVVAASNDETYFRYLESISVHYDELIIISNDDKQIVFNTSIENLKYVYVSELACDEINKVLEKVNTDWILWLHEGEKIDEHDLFRLRDWLYTLNGQIGLTQVVSTRHHVKGLFKHSDAPVARLFKNTLKFTYYSPQLELVDYSSIDDIDLLQLCGVKIYADSCAFSERLNHLVLREFELSISSIANECIATYYHAAYECYKWQKFNHARQYINKAIFQLARIKVVPPAYFYKLKYACLVEMKNDEHTLKGLNLVLQLYPNHTELWFYKALLTFKLKRYEQAKESFFHCIRLGNQASELTKQGVGSFIASFYMGLCFEKENDIAQATKYYSNALFLKPNYRAASKALERISDEKATIPL